MFCRSRIKLSLFSVVAHQHVLALFYFVVSVLGFCDVCRLFLYDEQENLLLVPTSRKRDIKIIREV